MEAFIVILESLSSLFLLIINAVLEQSDEKVVLHSLRE